MLNIRSIVLGLGLGLFLAGCDSCLTSSTASDATVDTGEVFATTSDSSSEDSVKVDAAVVTDASSDLARH